MMASIFTQCSVLILLDLSAAFDMVNHHILLSLLCSNRKACSWFESYLTGRSFSVSWQGQMSTFHHLSACVSQGSVLRSLLFVFGLFICLHSFSPVIPTTERHLQLNHSKTELLVMKSVSLSQFFRGGVWTSKGPWQSRLGRSWSGSGSSVSAGTSRLKSATSVGGRGGPGSYEPSTTVTATIPT
uniref:Uncharacterized protein n=1 Tax=Seriola lalandi dorsalis TaxID=1841481 RepID=A0A3B4XN26_SERLL